MAKKQVRKRKQAARAATAPKQPLQPVAEAQVPVREVDYQVVFGLLMAALLLVMSFGLIWWSYQAVPVNSGESGNMQPVPLGSGDSTQLQSGTSGLQQGVGTGSSATGDLNQLQPQQSLTPEQLRQLQ